MTNFANYHVGTAQPGGPCRIKGVSYQTHERPRGCVSVIDDSNAYFYQIARSKRGDFRKWATETFAGMNRNQLEGSWPEYRVVRR